MEERQKNNRFWVYLFCFCLVVIAGLTTGIIVNKLFNNNQRVEEDIEYDLPEELQGDDLSPEDQVIKETTLMMQNPDSSEADVEAYYDSVIEEALDAGDTGLAIRVVIQKMNFLAVVENNCTEAESYVDNLSLEYYSLEEKQYLASYIVSMAIYCNNVDLQGRWELYYEGE